MMIFRAGAAEVQVTFFTSDMNCFIQAQVTGIHLFNHHRTVINNNKQKKQN
jgi:hypothetical protein